jgi:hypothetical protein
LYSADACRKCPRSVAEDSNVRLSGTAMTVRPWIYDEPV